MLFVKTLTLNRFIVMHSSNIFYQYLLMFFIIFKIIKKIKRCKRCDKILYFNQLTVKNGIYCFEYKKENMITPT